MASARRLSAKVSPVEKRRSIFPYYAGFSTDFAAWALEHMGAKRGQRVLDPWNGSGTTTTAARALGAESVGIELSPVLVSVARARLAPRTDSGKLARYFHELSDCEQTPLVNPIKQLADWYHRCIIACELNTHGPAASLALCCLFPAVREVHRSLRTSNPSWYSRSPEIAACVDGIELSPGAALLAAEAVAKLHGNGIPGRGPAPRLVQTDIRRIELEANSFDYILTSPPYLTRLDYVQATYPELLLMKEINGALDLDALRKSMIGSPLTDHVAPSETLPARVKGVLERIKSHSSKASSTYYHRFFSAYFNGMELAFARVLPAVRRGGGICLVVQPSYYKDIYVDLPTLMAEMIAPVGFSLEEFMDFDARSSMASVNSRATSEARKPLHETALFFSKG
jgi:SAM-dependent methyltransferase